MTFHSESNLSISCLQFFQEIKQERTIRVREMPTTLPLDLQREWADLKADKHFLQSTTWVEGVFFSINCSCQVPLEETRAPEPL